MFLHRPFLATAVVALAASLMLPAAADQVFQNVSTGKLPAPTATYNPRNLTIDYLYYPCSNTWTTGNGVFYPFNPFNASNQYGPVTQCAPQHRHGTRPPLPPGYPGPGRVVPLATP